MAALFQPRCLPLSNGGSARLSHKAILAALVVVLGLFCADAFAQSTTQTTTVSGTVYDPRTTSAALPLPNVLVYVTTSAVAPLPAGVQCLTYQSPSGVVSYAYTDVQGNFTLANVPENTDYTLVIQAGKWRRQFPETVGASPLTGLVLNMPANHNEGDIPMIAIVTGDVDGVECVLRDMGIADTEFTDDTGSVNPGGHIHLYRGAGGVNNAGAGAEISASTPSETTLTQNSAVLNGYDMAMFPCQGSSSSTYQKSPAELSNVLDFANAGGRVFATHYSYVWLDPDSPYDSLFPAVANWETGSESQVTTGIGTVQTDFSDGATLAQWLQNAGATYQNSANQIQISQIRTDVSSVIPPTQSWLTYNATNNPVLQMTFNTPVGAPAAQQCGRVMYNDYHVINVSDHDAIFPSECPAETSMSAQEEMLEYALFDLSTFVQPVVVPTLAIGFNPSPLIVKEGDTGDQLVVNVTNTSSTTEIGSSAILSFTLPPLLSVTSMTDSTGGWNCTPATATCTRNSSLGGGVTDPVTLNIAVGAYPAGGLSSYTGLITATVASVTFSTNVSATDTVIYQQPPAITWPTPAPIVYGTALSSVQLDATAPIAGTFTYSPAAGTVLSAGQHTLSATFQPTDTTHYTSETATVTLTVLPAPATVNIATSAPDVFLTMGVTFTATIPTTGTAPTGNVTFYDGAASIGSSTLNSGSASITTTSLAAGTHAITAVYSGDSNYGAATSSPLAEIVQDFTLTAANGAASVPPASTASFTLTIAPVGGPTLPSGLSLSVTHLPAGTSALFNPAAITANSPSTNVILQVQLSGSAAEHRPPSPFGRGALPASLGLLLFPWAIRRRWRSRLKSLVLFAVAAAALAVGFSACGGASLSSQSFSIPVTAQSGALSHSVTLTLTVEPNQH